VSPAHSRHFRNPAAREAARPEFADAANHLFGEFRGAIPHPYRQVSVYPSVVHVLSTSAIDEIRGAIICGISVSMTDLFPVRTWPDEGRRDESMDSAGFLANSVPEDDQEMAGFLTARRL
jgi:hypothetical protein